MTNPAMTTVQKIEPDEAGLFWEARVSEALGVPRKELARLRKDHLAEPGDFVRRENNAVALTAQGLAKVEKLLAGGEGGDSAPRAGKPGKNGGKPAPACAPESDIPAGPPPRELMRVDRVAQNDQLLLCTAFKRTAPVQVVVRVRENLNFAPGMEIEAIQSGDGVWQFRNRSHGDESTVGRLPRRRGVW